MRAGVVLLLLATAAPVAAHPLAPALLEVRQGDAGRADVDWRVPVLRRPGPAPTPVLPSRCHDATPRETHVLVKGAYDKTADKVESGVLAVLFAIARPEQSKKPLTPANTSPAPTKAEST